MKLIIYIILFTVLIIYINKQVDCLENKIDLEKFTKNTTEVINIEPNEPDIILEWDANESDIYKNKLWLIKNQGFSDIYNYEDAGGEIIYNLANGFNTDKKSVITPIVKSEKITSIIDEKLFTNSDQIPNNFLFNNINFKLLGIASNQYFNQYYYIFENEIIPQLKSPLIREELLYIKNNKNYHYILLKMHNHKLTVIHYIGPRIKINTGDVIYLSQGSFQLGPLSINKIN
jgi:hypothetical protein